MAQLRLGYEQIVKKDAEVLVLGPEKTEKFQQYWKKEALPFVGLPDPTCRVLDLFGQEYRLLKLGRLPAQILVDKSGVVRFAHYSNSMLDIPAIGELLNLLDELSRGR